MAQQARVHSAILLPNPSVTKWVVIIAKTAALLADLSSVVNVIVLSAHLLCYPGAFNMTTGPLHWELLRTESKYGEVLASTDHDEAIFIAEIDYKLIEQRRVHLPFINQGRGDFYQLIDAERLNTEATS